MFTDSTIADSSLMGFDLSAMAAKQATPRAFSFYNSPSGMPHDYDQP